MRTSVSDSRADDHDVLGHESVPALSPSDDVVQQQLPFVIRPRALKLLDVESLLRESVELLQRVRGDHAFRLTLARGILMRDVDAQSRFADAEALARHLEAFVVG